MSTKVITGKVRFSFPNVFEPKAVNSNSDPKYSVSLLIPKGDTETLDKIKRAIAIAKEEGKVKLGKYVESKLKNPLRDGDEERPDDEVYAGHMFVNANSPNRPGVVGTKKDEFGNLIGLTPDEFYAGCYGRASVNFYAFNFEGTKGIACGLNNLQKTEDGDRLSGGSTAEEDFGGEDENDDLL